MKVASRACHNVALLTAAALLQLGLSHAAKVLDLTARARCWCRGAGDKLPFW
jgi:hypothetical protein